MDDILKRLKTPAVGLIIIGAFDFVLGAFSIISGLLRLAGVLGAEPRIAGDAEKMGYMIGTGLGYTCGFLSLVFGPIIIFGAIRMMKGKGRGLAMTAAVLAILPVTCCSLPLGMIFGIWALVVLRKPEVAAYFAGEYGDLSTPFQPPPPPPQSF